MRQVGPTLPGLCAAEPALSICAAALQRGLAPADFVDKALLAQLSAGGGAGTAMLPESPL